MAPASTVPILVLDSLAQARSRSLCSVSPHGRPLFKEQWLRLVAESPVDHINYLTLDFPAMQGHPIVMCCRLTKQYRWLRYGRPNQTACTSTTSPGMDCSGA